MWNPGNIRSDQPLYRAIAIQLASDVDAGILKPGDRLPTVRDLATDLGINMGTVYRAYTLAEQQGVVSKELGRGTFVRGNTRDLLVSRLSNSDGHPVGNTEDNDALIDMTRNEPPFVPLDGLLRQSLMEISRNSALDGMLEYGHSQGLGRHRDVLTDWLKNVQGLEVDAENMIVTGGAQQGLTIALGALATPGDTLLVEALSYPGVHNLAKFFGLSLRAVSMDNEGILPDALDQACRTTTARVLYCMPHAHNPTTATMGKERRTAIAAIAERHGLMIIEDDVNPRADIDDDRKWFPLARVIPGRTVYISSLSKIVAPGLRVGMIAAPPSVFPEVLAASQTTSWMAPPLMAELACLWVRNGTARELTERRASITAHLQTTVEHALAEVPYRAHPGNTHLWLPLPKSWSSREFVDAASSRGVLVSPSTQFAIDPSNAPPGVRLCLANVRKSKLVSALRSLAELYFEPPRPQAFRM